MILKDLVDPSEMRMERTVERMRSLTSNMMKDTFRNMTERNTDGMDAVISRDKDIDRLEWLVTRQTNMGHSNTGICRRMGLTQHSMMRSYTLCRIIERIGDHAVVIAKNAGSVMKGNMNMVDEVTSTGKRANELFDGVIRAWTSGDIYEANGCIRECTHTVELCRRINRYAMEEEFDTAMSATMIAGSIRRILEYSIDIAELVIDGSM